MKLKKEINIENSERAIKVAEVADALAHPLRVALIAYVKQKNTVRNDICNKDLVAYFPYSQSSLSQHIKKLRDANLFTVEYKDKFSFYSVNMKQIESFVEELKAL
ncbi:MAG: ArsR family transcriptional regulator [Bacteroidota bacterium]